MATDFDRQVALDLLMTPLVFTLEVVGVTMISLSGLDIIGVWGYLIGIGSMLSGIGWAISRIVLDPDNVIEQALMRKMAREHKALSLLLDAYDIQLKEARDWDVRRQLRELRNLHSEFNKLSPMIMKSMRAEIETQFLELFNACVDSLKKAHGNYKSMRESKVEKVKETLGLRRDKSLETVSATIEHVTAFISGLLEASDDKDETKIYECCQSLKENLLTMREAEEETTRLLSSQEYE